MSLALAEAKQAYRVGEVPVGAIVVYQGKVVAKAHNRVEETKDATAHAELLALQQACHTLGAKYLIGCSLYVTLEPCPMCAMAMYWTQLSSLFFGATDPKRGYRIANPALVHPKTKVAEGLLASNSQALLQNFFQERRKQPILHKCPKA